MSKSKSGRGRPLSLPAGVELNAENRINGVDLLAALPDACAKLSIFDPQYRGVLDKQKFGNEGARQKGRATLPQMSDDDIRFFVEELERVLKPSGHLMLWADKFAVFEGKHLSWTRRAPALKRVDMIHWNKIVPGMGRRARCYSEYLLVFQKEPTKAKGVWTDRGIMDSWPEGSDRTRHPHAKPVALTYRLIRSVTKTGDLVVDPCAGGYGVLEACRTSGRDFVGGDLI